MPTIHHPDGRIKVVPIHAARRLTRQGWSEVSASEPAVSRPNPTALKAGWVDWAVSQGADRAEAQAMTKEQLKQVYGG